MRTRKQVITAMIKTTKNVEHIGISIQPIASVLDPNNEDPGDYQGMVFFEGLLEQGKLFATPYRWTFLMDDFRQLPPDRFMRNMKYLKSSIEKFSKVGLDQAAKESRVVSDLGVSSLQDYMRQADRRKQESALKSTPLWLRGLCNHREANQ